MFLIILFAIFSTAILAQNPSTVALEKLSYPELDSLADVYYKKGAYQKVLPFLEASVHKSQKAYGVLDSIHLIYLGDWGYMNMKAGFYQKAESILFKTKDLKKTFFGEQHIQYASTLNSIAGLYYYLGEYEKSIPYLQEAKEIRKMLHGEKHPIYASSLNNLAGVYARMDKYEAAKPLYITALRIRKNIYGENSKEYARTLSNLGLLYQSLRDYDRAKKLLLEASAIRKEVLGEFHPAYSITLNNLALVYTQMGAYEKGEVLYLKVIEIRERSIGKEHQSYITALRNLAASYLASGNLEKGRSVIFEVLEISEKVLEKTHILRVKSFCDLAKSYIESNELDRAFSYVVKALEANSLNLYEVYPILKSKEQEMTWNVLSLNAYSKLKKLKVVHQSELETTLVVLSSLLEHVYTNESNLEAQKKAAESCFYVNKLLLEISEILRNNFSGKDDQLRQLANTSLYVKEGVSAAHYLGEDKFRREAFQFAEQSKSVLLADAVKGNRARILTDLPDSLLFLERNLQYEKDLIKKQKHQKAQEGTTIAQTENDLNERIEKFLQTIKENYPKYYQLRYKNITASVKEIQTLLQDKELFLEYIVTDTVTYLFTINSAEVQLYALDIGRKELKKSVSNLRKSLSNYDFVLQSEVKAFEVFNREATFFYNKLLKRALKNTNAEHLIIVADVELGHLPFEVFLTDKNSMKSQDISYKKLPYLLKKYSISYDYSATLWRENRKRIVSNNNHKILGLAAAYPKDATKEIYDFRPSHVADLRAKLAPLPAVKGEVEQLSQLFQGKFVKSLDANEGFFKAESPSYGVIHLAMHGILNPRIPILSSLAFSENKDSLEDNFLEAYEIAQLRLNADLVVLSACETGYGKFQEGEGILSLARSFMYAGVPSLVVSLWQVNDGSTALIMEEFYKEIAKGVSKDKALQAAKIEYLNNAVGISGHPAFWSPFIQLGDSSSIELITKTKRSWWIWIIVGGVVFVVAIFLVIRNKKDKI